MPLTPNRPTVANRVFRFLKPSHVYTRIYRVSTGEEGERMKNKGVVEKKKKRWKTRLVDRHIRIPVRIRSIGASSNSVEK